MLYNLMDAYLSSVSNSMNNVMKVLTVITGIYGMNFAYMPELEWRYGYLWALGIMAAVTVGMIIYIRRKHWL